MNAPLHGYGVGLRAPHFADWLAAPPGVDFVECITENVLGVGGRPRHVLEHVRRDHAVALHGVSLSIGSVDPLDDGYLSKLRALTDAIEPALVSDHLCWTSVDGQHLHELLPLPYTEESLAHVAARVHHVQERLGRPLVLENPSTYLRFAASTMDEPTFFAALVEKTGCGVLLDVNNVYVNAENHGFDARAYVEAMPAEAIRQLHLAGHADLGTHLVDTHDAPVSDAVWALYAHVARRLGPVPTLVEWDANLPPLARVVEEAGRARAVAVAARAAPVARTAAPRTLEAPR